MFIAGGRGGSRGKVVGVVHPPPPPPTHTHTHTNSIYIQHIEVLIFEGLKFGACQTRHHLLYN